MPQLTIRLDEPLWAALQAQAQEEDRPMAYLVVRALRESLATAPPRAVAPKPTSCPLETLHRKGVYCKTCGVSP